MLRVANLAMFPESVNLIWWKRWLDFAWFCLLLADFLAFASRHTNTSPFCQQYMNTRHTEDEKDK
eukprot:1814431-Amphidinium_carterae.1